MSTHNNFLTSEDFFQLLAGSIPKEEQAVLNTMRHTRVETGYRGRKFIVYRIVNRLPEKLATLAINDFVCDDEYGCSTQIEWLERPGSFITVGYEPIRLWDFPIFCHLPVAQKLRWTAKADNPDDRSLGFLIVLRTQSRLHLRERNVVYMETSRSYQEEFHSKSAA